MVEVNGYKIQPYSNLIGADLWNADLEWANLAMANLSGAKFFLTDLTWANLTGANLTGSVADGTTVWPEGVDPVAAGVIFV